MSGSLKTIAIDCERMKYAHTGLYHYCRYLANSLLGKKTENRKFCFYVPASYTAAFGKEACYIQQQLRHKFFFPGTGNIDLWHVTHQSTDYFPFKKSLGVVLTIHDLNYLYDDSKSKTKKAKYLEEMERKIDRADHLITISNHTCQDVQRHFRLSGKPLSVIYNGCTLEELPILSPPAYIPKKPFLFTIGTVVEKKNLHVLPSLLEKNDYFLVIAGITLSEAYKSRIIEKAKEFGVQNRVIFTGGVSENDKQWYLKNCKAFLFPSISEGFGLPVVEAMHFGKPVLLSKFTSLPEIGGEAAYYFPDFDPGSMQHTLTESLHHFEANNREQAVKERSREFTWERSAEKYLAVYNSLLE